VVVSQAHGSHSARTPIAFSACTHLADDRCPACAAGKDDTHGVKEQGVRGQNVVGAFEHLAHIIWGGSGAQYGGAHWSPTVFDQ
jgi:hypothetical protein